MLTSTLPWWIEVARIKEDARRSAATIPVEQFRRGLLTVEELAGALARILTR